MEGCVLERQTYSQAELSANAAPGVHGVEKGPAHEVENPVIVEPEAPPSSAYPTGFLSPYRIFAGVRTPTSKNELRAAIGVEGERDTDGDGEATGGEGGMPLPHSPREGAGHRKHT